MKLAQGITYTVPASSILPMPSFMDTTLGYGAESVYNNESVEIQYISPDLIDASGAVNSIIENSNKFLELPDEGFVNIPLGFNLTLSVETPITWTINYAYPQDMESYVTDDDYGEVESPLEYGSGLFSYGLSLNCNQSRFAEDGVFKGIKISPVNFSIKLSSFSEVDPNDYIENYFTLNPNPNTLIIERSNSETVNGVPLFDYTIQGSVR